METFLLNINMLSENQILSKKKEGGALEINNQQTLILRSTLITNKSKNHSH